MACEFGRSAPPEGFPSMPPIPAGRYYDEGFFRLEKDVLFLRSWLLAAHLDEVPAPGCFLRWDMAGPPVLITHAQDGSLHALINRCSHRGAPVAVSEKGARKRLICPYHGWAYGHDGELLSITEARDFGNIDRTCLGLHRLRCERLGKLVFVNFDSEASSLKDSMGSLTDEWAEFDLDNCRLSRRDRFSVNCNWKIAMEANMEVYHVPTVHRTSIAPILAAGRNVNTLYPGGHGRMVAPIPENSPQPEWKSSWPELASVGEIARTCTLSYNVFPNLVMPLNQYVVPPIQFWPAGRDRCVIETWTIAPDWGGPSDSGPDMWTEDHGARPNRVLREDIEISESIQANLSPVFARDIPLGYQEARIYHWHQSADAAIGRDRIDPRLRVDPVLGEQWLHPNEPRRKQ